MPLPLIKIENVSHRYGDKLVLNDVNLEVNEGDFMAVTGPNGGGKTTLLRIMLRLLKPTRGTVTYRDGDISFGYLPQKNMIDSRFPITVDEVISSGLHVKPWHRLDADERRRLDETVALMGLEERRDHGIGQLSGGQLQRALLGRAIISRPNVLVLDEPLSYIDKQFEQRLYELIEDIARSTTIVLVSHEMTTIATMATRHVIVDGGLRMHECAAHHHYVHTDCQ